MTPAALHDLLDVHMEIHDSDSSAHRERQVSKNPAADIAMLSSMTF